MKNRKGLVAGVQVRLPSAIHMSSSTALHCTWKPICLHRPPHAQVPTQALMAFQRSLSVLLMLPVWQGMEAMSSK